MLLNCVNIINLKVELDKLKAWVPQMFSTDKFKVMHLKSEYTCQFLINRKTLGKTDMEKDFQKLVESKSKIALHSVETS